MREASTISEMIWLLLSFYFRSKMHILGKMCW